MPWPVVGALVGAAASAFGQRSANKQNLRIAREQMKFQERMSSSAYQRATADMRKAGINPMLAYMQGGASSPGGASAQMQNIVPEGAASSAISAAISRKSMKLLDEQIYKTREEGSKARAEALIADKVADMESARRFYYFDRSGRPTGPLKELLDAEHQASMASSAQSVNQAALSALSIPEQRAIAQLFERAGSGGKAMQLLTPLILQMLRSGSGPGLNKGFIPYRRK